MFYYTKPMKFIFLDILCFFLSIVLKLIKKQKVKLNAEVADKIKAENTLI